VRDPRGRALSADALWAQCSASRGLAVIARPSSQRIVIDAVPSGPGNSNLASWLAVPAYYRAPLSKFVSDPASSIIGDLSVQNGRARFPLVPEAVEAWRLQFPALVSGCNQLISAVPEAATFEILLEYPIPRVGKRIDAVLLMHDVIVAIETKTGFSATTAERQVDDYAINLACFHEPSAKRTIIPLVVSDGHVASAGARPFADDVIRACRRATTEAVGEALINIARDECQLASPCIDSAAWDEGIFRPIPPIIDAAVRLYSDNEVFEIGHASAAREDLDKATNSLTKIVRDARDANNKAVCFITGVPGSGKTLVGLNAVHHKDLRDSASFLSGNGPLVKILREALIRDDIRRPRASGARKTRRAAETAVQAFIQSVHRFADVHYKDHAPTPEQRVLVFDEAQRAWDAKQNQRKKRPGVSEAYMMMDVMNRHGGWTVLVCLVGGGQEINSGEAGLSEWGVALKNFEDWKVYASPEVLNDKSGGPFSLFKEEDVRPSRITMVEDFHLRVCNRSIRSSQIATWVDAVLGGDSLSAKSTASETSHPPILSRDLSMVRQWLREKRRGLTRAGLVASSGSARLRSDGLETSFDFHQRFEWERWFLDRDTCEESGCDHKYCKDVRASSKLEVAATQFEIQGLELDWIGVCWGEDLLWNGQEWRNFNFSGKTWKLGTDDQKYKFRLNGYRVLLTRARQGMIIYVPKPNKSDSSRLHQQLDRTADFLLQCGAQELTPSSVAS
jgi:hypothetical protein